MQVETHTNMKSQVAGVRRSSDEVDQGRRNKKRIKLVHNSEENTEQNVMLESNITDNFSQSGNSSNISDHSEISNGQFNDLQENGQFAGVRENGQYTDVHENGKFADVHENGQFANVQENRESDNLNYYSSSSNGHELYQMENMNADIINENISFRNDVERESTSVDNDESEYLPPPTLIQYNDTYQYASNTFNTVKETENSLISYEESNRKDSEETILNNPPEITQSNSETILSNDPEIIQSSSSDTIVDDVPEVAQLSFSETVSKVIPGITKESSHDPLQIPSCSHEINASKPDGQPLSSINQEDVKYLGIYDLKTTQLEGHADVIFSVAADEKIVISSSGDTTLKMWDVENQKELLTFSGHSDAVTAVLLLNHNQSKQLCEKLGCSEVSPIVISASMDCHVKVWSACDGNEYFAKELSSVYTYNSITCIGYLQSESCVIIGTEGGKLEVWDLSEKKNIESTLAHESSISSLEVHENYVYSVSIDGAVKVWLFEEGELQPLYCRRRRETSQNGVDLGPSQWKSVAVNGDILFLGDNTPYLKTLNWRIGRLKLLVNQLGKIGECDAILAKENILLSTSYSSSTDTAAINVWSLPDMMYIGTLTGDVQDIYCLAITQFENKLRIISGGHQLTVWDFNLKEPPKENSNTSFSFCELEGLGTEVYDKPVEHTIPVTVSASKLKEHEENQGRCTIL